MFTRIGPRAFGVLFMAAGWLLLVPVGALTIAILKAIVSVFTYSRGSGYADDFAGFYRVIGWIVSATIASLLVISGSETLARCGNRRLSYLKWLQPSLVYAEAFGLLLWWVHPFGSALGALAELLIPSSVGYAPLVVWFLMRLRKEKNRKRREIVEEAN